MITYLFWRGANVQNVLTFEDRYEDVKVNKLLVNFRSTKAIIETANSFVQKTIPFERLPKEIRYHKNGKIFYTLAPRQPKIA